MSDLYWLSDRQMAKLEPFFPKSHGKPRVDDKRVLSGIIFINRNGLRWRDAPAEYGQHKTLYSRWTRWSEKGIFAWMLLELADQGGGTDTLMIDATHLKTHRTDSSLGLKKRGRGRLIGRTKGGMNSKLHAVTDAAGRPLRMFLTVGQRSDYIGARALLDGLPPAEHLLADRGYDADWYREALEERVSFSSRVIASGRATARDVERIRELASHSLVEMAPVEKEGFRWTEAAEIRPSETAWKPSNLRVGEEFEALLSSDKV